MASTTSWGWPFDQIRRTTFTGGQVAVLERLLEVLERAIQANLLPERRWSLWARAFTVARLAPGRIPDPEDAANFVVRAVDVSSHLLGMKLGVETYLKELADSRRTSGAGSGSGRP